MSTDNWVAAWETYSDGNSVIETQLFSSAPKQGEVIAASTESIDDIDGLGEFSFQWFADDQLIEGADKDKITLTQEQVDKKLTVKISYVDSQGFSEIIESQPTLAILNVNDQPTLDSTEYYLDGSNYFSGKLPVANDLDGDSITYHIGDLTGLKGTVALTSEGDFTYTQNNTGGFDDIFTVKAFDGEPFSEEVYMTLHSPNFLKVYSPDGNQIKSGDVYINAEGSYLNWVDDNIAISADKSSPLSLKIEHVDTASISISDVISQLRHIVGLDTLSGISALNADVDADGKIGISDVIGNLRVIVGLDNQQSARLVSEDGNFLIDPSVLPNELTASVPGDVDLSASFLDLI